MTLTRAQVETILIRRVGKLLTAAGLDGTTIYGGNADLNDPIGYAIQKCGGTVASLVAVADSDLSGIATADHLKLLDLAELRTLESINGNLDQVDITSGPMSQSFNQLSVRVRESLASKRRFMQDEYGLGLGTLDAGILALNFAETNES